MPTHVHLRIAFALAIATALVPTVSPAAQVPGPITVKQVLELFDTTDSDTEAGKLLFAYLSGIGETAGAVIAEARKSGAFSNCTGSLSLDGTSVESALRQAGGDSATRAATPVIIADMFERAGCR